MGNEIVEVKPIRTKQIVEKNSETIMRGMGLDATQKESLKKALALALADSNVQGCTEQSIVQSACEAFGLELSPAKALGEVYFVAYKDQCRAIIGYRGLMKLMRRSGVANIWAECVYERDVYSESKGFHPDLVHLPCLTEDRGSLVRVYCVTKNSDGELRYTSMNVKEVEQIKNRSRSGGSGPWVTDFEAMARKTVIRRHAKYMELNEKVVDFLEKEDKNESTDGDEEPSVQVLRPAVGNLRERVAARRHAEVLAVNLPVASAPPVVQDTPAVEVEANNK